MGSNKDKPGDDHIPSHTRHRRKKLKKINPETHKSPFGAGSTIGAIVFPTRGVKKCSLVYFEEKQLNILNKDTRRSVEHLDWVI